MDSQPQSRFYSSARLRLHYLEWGATDAPPVLLLHGWKDHARSWDWAARRLSQDYRVIVPDMRGHGDSAWSPDGDYTTLSLICDLAELVVGAQLAPLRIVGHSLGGNVTLRYTALYPAQVVKLVAIEGLGPSPKSQAESAAVPLAQRWRRYIEKRRVVLGRERRRYPTIEAAQERLQAANQRLSPAQARHLTEYGLKAHPEGGYSWKYDVLLGQRPPLDITPEQNEQLWAAVECPTLLCYGADSWASNPAEDGRARHFRHARVVMFEKAGHWLHHDQFERFIAEVQAFLR